MALEDLGSEVLSPGLFHDGPDNLVRGLGQSHQRQLRYRKLQLNYQSPAVQ
jgi:hypothetical protein